MIAWPIISDMLIIVLMCIGHCDNLDTTKLDIFLHTVMLGFPFFLSFLYKI